MEKVITGLIFITVSVSGHSERINGPANIRDSAKGEISFSLNDNVEVETIEPQNDWFEILISIKLTKEQYRAEPLVFKKGTRLFDMKGREIGITLKDLTIGSKMTAGGAPGIPEWFAAEIYGYTYKSNIRPESIVEPVISSLIESNKRKLTIEQFNKHLSDFGYVEGLEVKDMNYLKTYMVYESILEDPSPLDRIRLIFEGDNLIAIVHSRNLTITGFETVEIERGRKLTLTKDFEKDEKVKFIEKNKQTYWGID